MLRWRTLTRCSMTDNVADDVVALLLRGPSSPASVPCLQRAVCGDARTEYNEQRPHQALGGRAPAVLYQPSTRPYPEPARWTVFGPPAIGRLDATSKRIKPLTTQPAHKLETIKKSVTHLPG